MKKIIASVLVLVMACSCLISRAQSKVEFLDIGSKMTDYPKVDWLKGEPITHFDKDKIYVVELWATWCKPCIAAMPHINALNLKFKDKNVVFIGQGVMEGDKQKVETFISQKGDGLSYRVAFGGPAGSDFDKKWLKPAGISSIPQTFIIQNNTLVWMTYPSKLNEEILQLLVDGKFSIDAAEAINNKKK